MKTTQPSPVRSFPHAARVRRAQASCFRQGATLQAQHVNTRHIPDPAPELSDQDIEQLHSANESSFGDSPGSARATRRAVGIYLLLVVSAILCALTACGGGDPEDEPDRIDPPKDLCGPQRQHCV